MSEVFDHLLQREKRMFSARGRGHFHGKVIGMLVVFLGYKILILVFLGYSGQFCAEMKF